MSSPQPDYKYRYSFTGKRLPEKVTLAWLYKNIPVSAWLSLAASLVVAFGFGATVGSTTFVRELLGKSPFTAKSAAASQMSSDELKQRIDQLIQGHNVNVNSITKSIAEEEQAAGKSFYSTDSQPHMDSAKRLKEALKSENDAFEQQLKIIRELQK